MRTRLLTRLGVVLTVGLVLLIGTGTAASAHVSVRSDGAERGGFAEIAFRVPTESDTASTVKVQVAFPADTPIAHVSVLPHPGWTYQVTRSALPAPVQEHGERLTEAVTQIDWTATGQDTAVKPGEYEVFRISAGPLPDTDKLVFKVVQSYDDGQQVRWIDPPVDGSEPEHPAPVLPLAGGAGSDGAGSGGHGSAGTRTDLGDVANVGHVAPPATPDAATPAAAWWALAVSGAALLTAIGATLASMRPPRRGRGELT